MFLQFGVHQHFDEFADVLGFADVFTEMDVEVVFPGICEEERDAAALFSFDELHDFTNIRKRLFDECLGVVDGGIDSLLVCFRPGGE